MKNLLRCAVLCAFVILPKGLTDPGAGKNGYPWPKEMASSEAGR